MAHQDIVVEVALQVILVLVSAALRVIQDTAVSAVLLVILVNQATVAIAGQAVVLLLLAGHAQAQMSP